MTSQENSNRKNVLRRRAAKLGYTISFSQDRCRLVQPTPAGPVPIIAGLVEAVAVYLDAQNHKAA